MAVAAPKIAMLKLQPGIVEREASVTVVFGCSLSYLGLERLTHLPRSAIIVKIRLPEMARTKVNKLLEKLR